MNISHDIFDFMHASGNRLPQSGRENARTITETTDAPENASTPYTMSPGDVFNGSLHHGTDQDYIRIELTEGVTYTVSMIAGTMTDPFLMLGNQDVHVSDDDSGLGNNAQIVFTPTASGTYYIVAGAAFHMGGANDTGTYSVTVAIGEPPPGGGDPLNAITWGYTAPSTINVYFVPGGVTFDDEHGAPQTTSTWSAAEQAQAMAAFGTFEDVANVTFNVTEDAAEADFFMVETTDPGSGPAYWSVGGGTVTLDGTTYDDLDGFGVFYGGAPGWTAEGLEQGGAGFVTLLQQIGLGMGLAHPHDEGGASNVMQGVSAPFGDYGDADLNQGVFTMMSNNHGWPADPNGAGAADGYGHQGTPMALDVAVLQSLYGANNSHNDGDDIYVLPSASEAGAFYSTIWDTGGTDTIMYNGSDAAVIDLRTASLDYHEGGGGYVSHVDGVEGGFTIAQHVLIERAVGGRGDDTITGNRLNNWIEGHGGDDIILGGDGWDTIIGGYGDDVVTGGDGQDYFVFVKGHDTLTITDYNPQKSLIGWSDQIVLAGFGDDLTTASDLVPYMSQVGSDVVIAGGGQQIIIEDTFLSNLTAGDVIFI